ncbi:MAG TPA: AAA family ATPase [Marmoricola sp.]|nr:AAA family ATPase [Marmoricola sp.]
MTRATGTADRIDAGVPSTARWRRAPGLEVLGPARGSGLREATYLVRRGDDQMLQLSELLYLVLLHLEPFRGTVETAALVSAACGRTLTPDGVGYLVVNRLWPLGLVEDVREDDGRDDGGDVSRSPTANPLLALSVKGTLVPAPLCRRLAGALKPLYLPPVVLATLTGLVTVTVLVLRRWDLWRAVTELFLHPAMALAMYGLLTMAAVIHELGHAAACKYGGVEPGSVGLGVYIVFPAFYTDVTQSYRLGRVGRIRTDLGGLYFNAFCLLLLAGAYLMSGQPLFLLTWLVLQVQMVQQLVPLVRFDGYYVLADLAGVPDLFARVGPVLRSLWPGRAPDPRVTELKPFARRVVTGWVVLVVPVLTFVAAWAIWNLPAFVERGRAGLAIQERAVAAAWARQDWPMLAFSALSIALILLPLVGVAVLVWKLGSLVVVMAVRVLRPPASSKEKKKMSLDSDTRGSAEPETPSDVAQALAAITAPTPPSAAEFTDARMLPPRPAVPKQGWRRFVHVASGHTINPGPSREELRREELEGRLRTPIAGSRRVVVMSRKGGVGKTTMTLALGSIFAMLRGDRVSAVDANPDAGNLAHRVAPTHDRKITDVLRDADEIDSYSVLRDYTSQAAESRLEVLASDDDPRIGQALDRADYHKLITLLDRFYNLILLDTGTGILDSANQGLLQEADQVVLVLGPGLDGGRAAALTLDWMDQHGFGELVAHAVVVINGLRSGSDELSDSMRGHFEKRCQRVLTVPWDPALVTGAQTNLSALHRHTREALVQVAAAVADSFRELGARR